MAQIDFPTGLQGSEGLPQTRRVLKNYFYVEGKLIQRPGITAKGSNSRVARGAFEWHGGMYEVASQDLLKVAADGSFSVIGTIEGNTPIVSAPGFNDTAIIVKGGNGYTLDKSDTLTQITDPNFVASDSVCHINGRFVYIPSNGDPAKFSDVGAAGTIQPESFFDAEELPDQNRVCVNLRNSLVIGGTDSFELFKNLPNNITTFTRLNGRVDTGYIGGIVEYASTFLFIGREKYQDFGIYAFGTGEAPKISNEFIDNILSGYTETELALCISNRIKHRGYDLATFTLAGHSFGYFQNNWFELDAQVNGENQVWQAGYVIEHDLKYYSFYSDKIGELGKVNREYGHPIERAVDFGIDQEGDFAVNRIQFNLSQGFGNAGSAALQASDDNVVYGPKFYIETGEPGHHNQQLVWEYPGGLGSYRDFAGFRISTTEDIDASARSLFIA